MLAVSGLWEVFQYRECNSQKSAEIPEESSECNKADYEPFLSSCVDAVNFRLGGSLRS